MKIVLASSSPRRVQLLSQMGINFVSAAADIDETQLKKETPAKMVARLSIEKAHEVLKKYSERPILLIAADTTVVHPNGKVVLGKPVDLADSKKMIRAIQGKTHTVLTGFSVLHVGIQGKVVCKTKIIRTQVKIRKLSSSEINNYVLTNEGLDKAGAYAAQGIGMGLIESIRGSYTNVVGLPVAELWDVIHKWIPKI